MKKVKAFIEKGTDGIFSVYTNDDSLEYSVNGQGKTAEEAVADFEAVYNEMKNYFASKGLPFTEVTFDYKYDLSALLATYAEVFTLVGLSHITGINKSQLSHYLNGTSRPTSKTAERITAGIRNYATRLSQLSLA